MQCFRLSHAGFVIGERGSALVIDSAPRRACLTHDGMLSAKGPGMFNQRTGLGR